MKTMLLPEPILNRSEISKEHWPKVVCQRLYQERTYNGRLIRERVYFEFCNEDYMCYREYNSRNVCTLERVFWLTRKPNAFEICCDKLIPVNLL